MIMYTKVENDFIYESDKNTYTIARYGTLFDYLVRYRKSVGYYSTGGTVRRDEDANFFGSLTTGRLLKKLNSILSFPIKPFKFTTMQRISFLHVLYTYLQK